MRKSLLKTIQNNAAVMGGSLLLFIIPVVMSNCTGSQAYSRANDFNKILIKNGDWGKIGTKTLTPYRAICAELNELKKVNPEKYGNYTPEMLYDEYRANGIDFFGELAEGLDLYHSGKAPRDVDTVFKYLEWKKQQEQYESTLKAEESRQKAIESSKDY